jgi:hypothetical protein
MKIDSRITEERKVRCTGCRIVILLTPDPEEPDGMRVSIPKKSDKPKGMSESKKRILLSSALVALAIVVAIGLWLTLRGPQTHATVDGNVTVDGVVLEKGLIEFETLGTPNITAKAGIVRGRYSISAGLGNNKVRITGDENTTVAPKYNKDTELQYNVGPKSSSKDFEVSAKK